VNSNKLLKRLAAAPLALALGLSFSTTANADPVALIIKTGSYTLSDESQRISNITLTFEDKADGLFGLELEWRQPTGTAFGLELLRFTNDWRSNVGTRGDNDTLALLFNVKKYFNASKVVRPYIGAGIGVASVDFTGPGGSASGEDLALQAMGGIEFRGQKVGFYTEVKYLSSKPEDDVGANINVSGTGLFAGLSIFF